MRAGLVALALVSLSACIFDKGDYKGGGHVPLLTATPGGDDGGGPPGDDGGGSSDTGLGGGG